MLQAQVLLLVTLADDIVVTNTLHINAPITPKERSTLSTRKSCWW